jgi:hypothetical protein
MVRLEVKKSLQTLRQLPSSGLKLIDLQFGEWLYTTHWRKCYVCSVSLSGLHFVVLCYLSQCTRVLVVIFVVVCSWKECFLCSEPCYLGALVLVNEGMTYATVPS